MDSGVSNLTCYYSHFWFEVAHTFSTWCSWQLISWTGIYSGQVWARMHLNYKCNFNYKFYSWLNLLTSKIWTNFVQQQTRMPHEQNRNIGDWTYELRNAEALKQFMEQCQKLKFHFQKHWKNKIIEHDSFLNSRNNEEATRIRSRTSQRLMSIASSTGSSAASLLMPSPLKSNRISTTVHHVHTATTTTTTTTTVVESTTPAGSAKLPDDEASAKFANGASIYKRVTRSSASASTKR